MILRVASSGQVWCQQPR